MKDRDHYVEKHTPRGGVPTFVDEEDSKAFDTDARKELRSKRPTDKRIEKLEQKHDALDEKVDAIHGDVREMRGELKSALAIIVPERAQVHTTERHRMDSRTKVIIAIVGVVGSAITLAISQGCV